MQLCLYLSQKIMMVHHQFSCENSHNWQISVSWPLLCSGKPGKQHQQWVHDLRKITIFLG